MAQLSEVKHTLRKLEFPLCAKEALTKIGILHIIHFNYFCIKTYFV